MARRLILRTTLLLTITLAIACAPAALGEIQTPETPMQTPASTDSATATASPSPLPPTTMPPPPTVTPTLHPTPTTRPTTLPPLIAIDPGHGGEDLGAVRVHDDGSLAYSESDTNLALALRTRDALLARGYRVLLTRDGDYGLNPEGHDVNGDGVIDHRDDLQMRIDLMNAANADVFISIHQNAFFWPDGRRGRDVGGTVTFYNAYRPFSDENKRLALLVQQELVAALNQLGHDVFDRGIQVDHQLEADPSGGRFLIVLGPESERIARASEMPGVLSETLFMTHDQESELLQDPHALDALAEAYALAVDRYFQGEGAP